jgi:hypothetical protein
MHDGVISPVQQFDSGVRAPDWHVWWLTTTIVNPFWCLNIRQKHMVIDHHYCRSTLVYKHQTETYSDGPPLSYVHSGVWAPDYHIQWWTTIIVSSFWCLNTRWRHMVMENHYCTSILVSEHQTKPYSDGQPLLYVHSGVWTPDGAIWWWTTIIVHPFWCLNTRWSHTVMDNHYCKSILVCEHQMKPYSDGQPLL